MGDFYQTGNIATFHRLGELNLEKIETELKAFSRWRPIALILPSLFEELEGEALPRILEELKKVRYLRQVVVSLDRASAEQFEFARRFFRQLPHEVKIIWQDGPRLLRLYKQLESNGFSAGASGKGRGVWMAFGYVAACDQSDVIALHDCDILTVDIIEQYEHKHQQLSPGDAQTGLQKMCIDITKSIFYNLANEGVVLSNGMLRTLQVHYLRTAQETLKRYEDDAAVNGLAFDRNAESEAVETFSAGIRAAADIILKDPFGAPLIPTWSRVTSAIPDFLERLQTAVEADNRLD